VAPREIARGEETVLSGLGAALIFLKILLQVSAALA
jgi:hypothetical protein